MPRKQYLWKIEPDAWELVLMSHLLMMVWDSTDTGGKWVTGKPFGIKLLLLGILLSSAVLLWGCPSNFLTKAWTYFLVFCLFMTWYRPISCHSGCIFLYSFKHDLNSPRACSRICRLLKPKQCIFPACQPMSTVSFSWVSMREGGKNFP